MFIRIKTSDSFEQSYHSLLHHIFTVSPGDIVRLCLIFNHALVLFYKNFLGGVAAFLRHFYQLAVRKNV